MKLRWPLGVTTVCLGINIAIAYHYPNLWNMLWLLVAATAFGITLLYAIIEGNCND